MLLLRLLLALVIVHLTLCNGASITNRVSQTKSQEQQNKKLIKFKGIYASSLRLPMVRSSKPHTANASGGGAQSNIQDGRRENKPTYTTASTSINDEFMNKKRLLHRVTKKLTDRVKVARFKRPNINISDSINNLKKNDVFNQNKRKKILILMSDTGIFCG